MHPRIKQIIYTLVLASVCGAAWAVGGAGQYQWSVGLRGYVSAETGKEPQAFLWLPQDVDTVRAVIVAQQNMTEERILSIAWSQPPTGLVIYDSQQDNFLELASIVLNARKGKIEILRVDRLLLDTRAIGDILFPIH